jgi:hypothetical protein
MAYAKYTEVPVTKTRGEIERLLEVAKAAQYGTAVDYDSLTARVQFRLQDRIVRFTVSLPDRRKLGEMRFVRAERQRWRALLLVLKAKLESVESGIETFDSAFLAQIVMPNDTTVGDLAKPLLVNAYRTGKMPLALTAAPDDPKVKP